jgi:hypothetical protein
MKNNKKELFILGVRNFGQFTKMPAISYGVGNTPKRTVKRFHGVEYSNKAEKKAIKKLHKEYLNRKAA